MSDVASALAAARELLEHDTVVWNRSEEPEILGVLRNRTLGETERSHGYPVLTIETGDGRWLTVHGFHRVLWDEIEAQDPHVGDVVGIRHLGRVQSGKGADGYEHYKLAVVRMSSPGVDDPVVTGTALRAADTAPAAAMQPPGDPVRQVNDGASAEHGASLPSVDAPPLERGRRRVELWAELCMRAEQYGLKPEGVLNSAVEGARFTHTSAPASATVEELLAGIEWIKRTPSVGAVEAS